MEIPFNFHKRWVDEFNIAKRVMSVISPRGEDPIKIDDYWLLGSGNNYRLRIDLQERTAFLKCRYGMGSHTDRFVESLHVVLNWIFD